MKVSSTGSSSSSGLSNSTNREKVSKLPKLYESNFDSYAHGMPNLDFDSKLYVPEGTRGERGLGYGSDDDHLRFSYEKISFTPEALELYYEYFKSL